MSPKTDLFDIVNVFRNSLQYDSRKEAEVKDLLKNYKEHLVKVKLKRIITIKIRISRKIGR